MCRLFFVRVPGYNAAMSRTVKGAKGAGYDYQARRLGNQGGMGRLGPIYKRATCKWERRAAHVALSREGQSA